jgi:hypothetical protein
MRNAANPAHRPIPFPGPLGIPHESYGYDVVKRFASDGSPIRGDRAINEGEAGIVRRIFEEYASGDSPRTIAARLNREKVPGPSGRGGWGASTIHGHRERGTGILNNELYASRIVWNRLRYIKDPSTGKRVSRINPVSEWINRPVPDLRPAGGSGFTQEGRQTGRVLGPAAAQDPVLGPA